MTACGEGSPEEYPGPPAVVLGTGYFEFEPIEEKGAVPIVRGPQGGYHIWVSVRARYMDPDGVDLCLTLSMADTEGQLPKVIAIVDLSELQAGGDPGSDPTSGDGWGESLGNRLFVPSPEQIDGKLAYIAVEARGREGRVARDSRLVVPSL